MTFSIITDGQGGESVRTGLNSVINYLNGLGLDIEFSADATSWHYGWQTGDEWIRFSSDFGSTWSSAIYLSDADTLSNYVEKEAGSRLITSAEITKLENLTGSEGSVFSITLPSSTTIAGRIAGAIDVPTGWTLSEGANSANLDIAHNLGRRVANVSVTYLISGTEYKALVPFNNAYSTFSTQDVNNLRIEGLTTIQKTIQIFITFE